ncbi:hypothetical protein DL764_000408 [Monosporascus ibericus]|uniref:Oxidoreductase n=1 Tax=Monosporascus ibericus TaxID=155417 RepID=A0A4Q4TTM7_9PEZI|nr:hypothetical protein DL764_000408 [Monosporascus ibericus]
MAHKYNKETTSDELVKDFAPCIKGSVIITTGVSPGGVSEHFVRTIARGEPALMIFAGRSVEKTQKVADTVTAEHPNVKVRVLKVDLGSLASVREAAAAVNGWADVPYVDVLVNNAAVMAVPYHLTSDGFESQFGTNHLGHFLFTNLIIDKIMASKNPRIVNVSSDGHRLNPIRWDDLNFDGGKTYNKWQAYGQSKTANMLFSLSLAERLGPKGLLAFSLHPGHVMGTTLGAHCDWSVDFETLHKLLGNKDGWSEGFSLKDKEHGAATHVFAAYSPDIKEHNGGYFQDSRLADPYNDIVKPWATSPIEADRLWKLNAPAKDTGNPVPRKEA